MALPEEKARYTFADCLTWKEKERIEIINGEAVMIASSLHFDIADDAAYRHNIKILFAFFSFFCGIS